MQNHCIFSEPADCIKSSLLFSFRPFIRYCMKRVNLLRQYDITPVMVFDGGYLPTKSRVEKDRRE